MGIVVSRVLICLVLFFILLFLLFMIGIAAINKGTLTDHDDPSCAEDAQDMQDGQDCHCGRRWDGSKKCQTGTVKDGECKCDYSHEGLPFTWWILFITFLLVICVLGYILYRSFRSPSQGVKSNDRMSS